MSEQGRKYDGGKLRYDLIPVLALEDMVKGLTFGTIKYDDNNWVKVPNGRKRYLAAALRHIQEYRKGNLWDEEQDIHHLSAAMNNLSFIVEKDLQGWGDTEEEDISQEELKDYIGFCVDRNMVEKKEELESKLLWYPPVEDGGNPWIEWRTTFLDICPETVSESTMIDILMDYEREEEDFETSPQEARGWYWGDSSIVAYRVV